MALENEGVGPKSSLVSSSDGQVAVGKRKGVKVGDQRVRGSLPKSCAVESVGIRVCEILLVLLANP